MACKVRRVLAPNFKDSIQYARIIQEISPYTKRSDVQRRAMEIWLTQHSDAFAKEQNQARDNYVSKNTFGLTPDSEMASRLDANKQWAKDHADDYDANGELKFEKYYQADKYKNSTREDWMTTVYEEYISQVDVVEERTEKVIDAQINMISELANRSKLLNVGNIVSYLKSGKRADGRSMVNALVLQSQTLIDGGLYSLKSGSKKASSAENDHEMYESYKLIKAFNMLEDLRGALITDSTLARIYAKEIDLLNEATGKIADAKSIYEEYLRNSVAELYASMSENETKESIVKLLKTASVKTTALGASVQYAMDSPDAIVSLTAKLISEKQDNVRREVQEVEDQLADAVGRLEKHKGTTNPELMYENFLLKDESGKITNKWLHADNSKYQHFLKNGNEVEVAIYQEMHELYTKMQTYIPSAFREKNYLPGIEKAVMDKFTSSGSFVSEVKSTMEHKFLSNQPMDSEYGNVDESGNPINFVPIYFTNTMNRGKYYTYYKENLAKKMNEVAAEKDAVKRATEDFSINTSSKDVGNAIMAYAAMAINHREMNTALFAAEGVLDMVKTRSLAVPNRKSNQEFTEVVDDRSNDMVHRQLESLIRHQIYGISSESLGTINLSENINIDIRKTAEALRNYNSVLLMGMNLMAAQVNVLMGESMSWAETAAREHFNAKDFLWANVEYSKNIPLIASDVTRRKPKSKVSILLRHYDVLGDYRPDKAESGHGKFKKLNITTAAMFFSSAGEHMIQSKAFMARLKATKVYDKVGNETGNLWDAHTIVDGKSVVKPDTYIKSRPTPKKGKSKDVEVKDVYTKYDIKAEQKQTRNTQEMLRRMHGNYNEKTAVSLQRNAIAGLAYQFRKWIPAGFERRFGNAKYSEAADDFREGNYRSTARYLGALYSEIKAGNGPSGAMADMTVHQQANLRRTTHEVGVMLVLLGSNIALTTQVESDDDPLYNNFVYVINRLSNEMQFYGNPAAIFEIVRTPAASVSTVQVMGDVVHYLMPWNWSDKYMSGRHKDQNKLLTNSKKLIPLYKQLDTLTPAGLQARVDFILN